MAAPSPKQRAVTLSRQGFDDSVIGAILGLSADDVRALLYEAAPDVELPGGGDELPVFQTSVDLDYDQMRRLPTVPVEILPDPPAGSMWLPYWAFLQLSEVGDFGGWENTSSDPVAVLQIEDRSSNARRLAQSEEFELDNLFVPGGGVLLIPEMFTIGNRTVGRPLDAANLDTGVSVHVFNQPFDFEPFDEGGYPDSTMRITIAYSQIEKTP